MLKTGMLAVLTPLLLLASGCSQILPASGNYFLQVDLTPRTFRMYVPSTYNAGTAIPLVIALHGLLDDGNGFAYATGLEKVAEERGFVVVFPDGLNRAWEAVRQDYILSELLDVSPRSDATDDVTFINTLIDTVAGALTIDDKRVYVTGSSNGGMMSFLLAQELTQRIAAIAVVSASLPADFSHEGALAPPMPLLMIHGTDDTVIPYKGGVVLGWEALLSGNEDILNLTALNFLSVESSASRWARLNHTDTTPTVINLPDADPKDGTTVRKTTYENGAGGSQVVLYTVKGGGHTWPGGVERLPEFIGGATSRDIDASEIIWDFFDQFLRK